MATGVFYANSSETAGLYGNTVYFGATYFEWFVFKVSPTQPGTPTGGSWDFTTNSGTVPSGWTSLPPTDYSGLIWVSITVVDSNNPGTLTWSVPGVFTPSDNEEFVLSTGATKSAIIPAGTTAERDTSPVHGYFRFNTDTVSAEFYNGTAWKQVQSVDAVIPISTGGTGATTAAGARTNLGLGSIATQAANSVAITGGTIDNVALGGTTTVPVANITGQLAIVNGGTAANTAAQALINLGERTGATGSVKLPAGTTAQRDGTPSAGYIRYNTTITKFEGYNGTAWSTVGGGATGGGSDSIFNLNGKTVTTNYTIPSDQNANSVGPITINSGISVTVPSGCRWVVL